MNLHEYQAKQLLADYGIAVPRGTTASSADGAREAARALGGSRWVVKAQAHTGGRGKAGGVRVVDDLAAVADAAGAMIGSRLVTAQSGPAGLPVDTVLIEEVKPIARELYLGALVDRSRERIAMIGCAEGGVDIEEVAAEHPERILSCHVDPVAGIQAYQGREMAFAFGLSGHQVDAWVRTMTALCRLLVDKDLSQVEINPLIIDGDGKLLALDAKINIDDNALYAHPELVALRDAAQEDPTECAAHEHGLSYVTLGGNIGCMVNGAGLAMATMDMVRLRGGMPANFLDVGGGTTAARVAEAFKLILADKTVRAVLVNIFGGIVRCDLIAEGIIAAIREVHVAVPVIVRLEGTNAEAGRSMLANADVAIITAADLDEAARKAVEAARP
ncbi:MAG: ADP-forming succinate--CoA ligase subunit beta [Methylotetracoccus sp.]